MSNQINTNITQLPEKIQLSETKTYRAQTEKTIDSTDMSASLNSYPVIEIGIFPAIIGVVVFLVGLGIAWGTLKTLVSGIKKTLDNKIEPDLKNIRERFSAVETKVDTMWKNEYAPSNSPRQLNIKGKNILEVSGIKEIVDKDRVKLFDIVKRKEMKNAYDAEERIFKIMNNLPKHCPEVIDNLKTGAFKAGVSLDAVLFVGAIYLRNLIFKDLGFNLTDLDKK